MEWKITHLYMICLIENGDFHSYVSLPVGLLQQIWLNHFPMRSLSRRTLSFWSTAVWAGTAQQRIGWTENQYETITPQINGLYGTYSNLPFNQFCNPTQIQLGVQLKYWNQFLWVMQRWEMKKESMKKHWHAWISHLKVHDLDRWE